MRLRHMSERMLIEWMNKTLLEQARCMLSNVELSKEFWAKVVNST